MKTGSILIVDDSDNIRSVLQMNFEWLGYQVSCARDGEEALRILAHEPPDLIILDVMMPRRNGYQVCRSLKMDPRLKEIPVIFLTAKDQKEDRFWGKDCGADEYLTKPFSAAKLERVIERLLEEREKAAYSGGDVTDRIEQLKKQGASCSIATFRLDRKALMVFRQKYGEIRYQEVVEAIRHTLEVVLRAELSDYVIERSGEGIFRAALHCGRTTADQLTERICTQAGLLLRSFYGREDSERGFIVSRTNPSGTEVHVPLMALEASLVAEVPAA
jgi:DNA-binding response OmpR family regulator